MAIAETEISLLPRRLEASPSFSLSRYAKARAAKLSFFVFCFLLGFPPADFHREWMEFIENNDDVVVMAPRNHAKSTFSYLLAAWLMLFPECFPRNKYLDYYLGEGKDVFKVLVVTNATKQAKRWMREFRKILSQAVQEFALPVSFDVDNKELLTLKWGNKNWSELETIGLKSSPRGARAHLIIGDDLQKDILMKFSEVRNLFEGVIRPVGFPYTKRFIVGTTLGHNDYLHHLAAKPDIYTFKKYKAINEGPDGEQYALWEKQRPLEWLYREREAMINPLTFAREYQNEPISDETSAFPWKTLVDCRDLDAALGQNTGGTCFMGVDPAPGTSPQGDWNAFTLLEVNEVENPLTGNYSQIAHVREIIKIHGSKVPAHRLWNRIITVISSLCENYDVREVYIEKNIMSTIVSLAQDPQIVGDLRLPITGIHTGKGKHSTEIGVPSVGALMQFRKILLPYIHEDEAKEIGLRDDTRKIINELSDELMSWQYDVDLEQWICTSKHDDVSMSFWHAVRAWQDNMNSTAGTSVVRVSF